MKSDFHQLIGIGIPFKSNSLWFLINCGGLNKRGEFEIRLIPNKRGLIVSDGAGNFSRI